MKKTDCLILFSVILSVNWSIFLPSGLGGSNVYFWNIHKISKSWSRCNTKFELPPQTLVYGEIVTEFRGEHKGQRRLNVFHMIDGLFLNGYDISELHVVERYEFVIVTIYFLKKFIYIIVILHLD